MCSGTQPMHSSATSASTPRTSTAVSSMYTVETHIRYLAEVAALEPLDVHTQVLGADEKRLHLFHALAHARTGESLATGSICCCTSTRRGRSVPSREPVAVRVAAVAAAHASLPVPEGRVARSLFGSIELLVDEERHAHDDEHRACEACRVDALVEDRHARTVAMTTLVSRTAATDAADARESAQHEDVRTEGCEPGHDGWGPDRPPNGRPAASAKREHDECDRGGIIESSWYTTGEAQRIPRWSSNV